MSIFDRGVSRFNGVDDTSPKTVYLHDWLKTDYRSEVERLRQLPEVEYKSEKKKLPCITPSGIFHKRAESKLIKHSGLIQFDIDNLGDVCQLKVAISKIPFVAYCGLSTSGNGLWGLIPITYPEQHKSHFKAIEAAFQDMGVTIDPQPQNPVSLRFVSYDPEPYVNDQAELFPYLSETPKVSRSTLAAPEKVMACIEQIERNQIDITGGYETWFPIGTAFVQFGEQGKEWFHRISQYSPKYDFDDLNKQWAQWNQAGASADIGVFYNACKDHGILFKTYNEKEVALYGFNLWTGEIFDERGYPSDWDNV